VKWFLLLSGCSTPQEQPAPPTAAPEPLPAPAVEIAPRQLVVITLDTTRADRLGSYGYAAAATPNLDALAERGVRFANAFAPVPLTIPSHSTLFTGLLPPHHGVHVNGDARLSDEAYTLAERLQDSGWRTHAAVGAYVTQQHWGFGQGFDGYDDEMGLPTDRLSWRAERPADQVIDDALAALDQGAEFLWVHVFDAHSPYQQHEGFEAELPYDSELAFIDSELGRLLGALDEDATIVVTGDHGEGFGAGGEEEHGLLVTRETLHVPLIVVHPGLDAGTVVERAVGLADITPTLLRLLDIPPGDTPFDGADLLQDNGRSGVYSEALQGQYLFGWSSLRAWNGDDGRLIRGTTDTEEGAPPDDAGNQLDEAASWTTPWNVGPLTLDPTQVEQLQALGYMASPSAEGPEEGSLDPRDGIDLLKTLRELHQQPPEKQEETLRSFADEYPQMRDVRFRLGRLLAQQGRLDEAVSAAEEAYLLAPDSTTAIFVGSLWMQMGQADEALQWYREAMLHDPRSLDARAGEVESLIRLGLVDEARATAEVYLETVPDHGRMLLAGAMLALAEGAPVEQWLDPVTTLAQQRPYEQGALQIAAALQVQDGSPEQAIALLRTELRWRPYNMSARLELTMLFREQQRLVDVIKTIRPLLHLQPDEPQWHAIAAEAYIAMGRLDRAEPHLAACGDDPRCPKPEPEAAPATLPAAEAERTQTGP
jgi:tetratricopeptide (TPR) repeat protein